MFGKHVGSVPYLKRTSPLPYPLRGAEYRAGFILCLETDFGVPRCEGSWLGVGSYLADRSRSQ